MIDPIAECHAATGSQIALAWLLHYSLAPIPIPGTTSIAHLRENLAAVDIDLTPYELSQLSNLAE